MANDDSKRSTSENAAKVAAVQVMASPEMRAAELERLSRLVPHLFSSVKKTPTGGEKPREKKSQRRVSAKGRVSR